MSEKKKTVKKADAAPHTQASPKKLEAAKAELAKMIEGVQNGEKLLELIDTGYKKGKLSSGEMMETLDSISLESEQMDKVYDVLENLGIDTAGDDFPRSWRTTSCPRWPSWRRSPRRRSWTPTPWWTPSPSTIRCGCT